MYCKTNGDTFVITEHGGSQRGKYLYSDISIYDIGGGAETFTSALLLMQRLEALSYVGFYYDGEVIPADLISTDASNTIIVGTDGKLYASGSGSLLREEFNFTASQTFTLANDYGQVYSVEVSGQGALSTSQYTLVPNNQITINDTLNTGDYIVVIYSDAIAGVQPYYTQAQVDALLLNVRPYKVYIALLSQSGTDAPVATVLENTLGGTIMWTRNSVGNYIGTLSGVFIENKVFMPPFSANFEGNSVFLPISGNGNPQHGWINMYRIDDSTVEIDTYDMVGYAEWSTIIGSSMPIEIRVYN